MHVLYRSAYCVLYAAQRTRQKSKNGLIDRPGWYTFPNGNSGNNGGPDFASDSAFDVCYLCYAAVLISLTKTMTKNIR